MNKQLLALTTAILTTTAASAGGYIEPTVLVAPEAEVMAPAGWSGPYIGGTLGMAFGGDDSIAVREYEGGEITKWNHGLGKFEVGGLNYGLHLGYRTERNGWVLGPELSYEAGDVSDSMTDTDADGTLEDSSNVDSVLSLKLKAGRVIGGNTLVYGVLGAARGDFAYESTFTDTAGVSETESAPYDATGYVIGAGIERKVSDRISVTGEWNYYNFGKTDLFLEGDAQSGLATYATPAHHRVKLGLNYQF